MEVALIVTPRILKGLRHRVGKSSEEMATYLEVSEVVYNSYERGFVKIPDRLIPKLNYLRLIPTHHRWKPKELRHLRTGLGLSSVKMAERLEVPPNTWRSWERGQAKPPREVERKLTQIMEQELAVPEWSTEWAKRARIKLGLTMKKIGELAGVSESTWSRYEAGLTTPQNKREVILKIQEEIRRRDRLHLIQYKDLGEPGSNR